MRSYRRILWIGLIFCLGIGSASAAEGRRQGSRIDYGQTVEGSVSTSGSDQEWHFAGRAGELVVVDMRAVSADLDPYLTLLTPDGNAFRTDDDGGDGVNSRIGPVLLPDDGDYTILAGSYSGSGGYRLGLTNLSTIPALVPGKPLAGAVNASQPNEYFLLDTSSTPADQLFRLEIDADDLYYFPWMAVYGPDGFIASTESAYDTSAIDPLAPAPGETYMVAVSWNSSSSGGAYLINLVESEVALLQDGVAQTGTVDYENYVQRHYFRAEEGEQVRLTVRAADVIAPAISVSTVDYAVHLFGNSGEVVSEVSIVLPISISTTYLIEISDGAYTDTGGSYEITLERIAAE